ncbi:MAG: restriction endonuclease subunit S [Alphaproteobacteria bacterium]|nr:restriction endonuclease subunit S [Alphaproteobacteria bacterium]
MRDDHTRRSIGDLCDFFNGNGFRPPDWRPSGLPIIRIQNLNGSQNFNYFDGEPKPKWIVEPGDLLFAWAGVKGVSFGPTIWPGPRGVLNQHIFRVVPKKGVDKYWLYLALQIATRRIESNAHGFKSSLVHVHKDDITNQVVDLPPLPEQRKIAEILRTWDEAIEKLDALRAAKAQQLEGFTARLIHRAQAEPQHLREHMSEVSERNRGQCVDRVLSVTNSAGFVLAEEQFAHRVASADISNYKIVRQGQYAYNPSRINVGSIARLDDWPEGALSPMYVVFDLRDTLDTDFFSHWLRSGEARKRIALAAQGSVRDTVSFGDLGSIQLPIPPIEEQRRIARVLSEAKEELSLLDKEAEALTRQKRGLMQKLLTGEWRVAC